MCYAKLGITFSGQVQGAHLFKRTSVSLEVVSCNWDWQKTDEIVARSLF